MSTNHNRIKVADLETNQPNKILITNLAGELEFSAINTIKVDSYNALDYTSEGKNLDARQGKVLKDLADSKVDKVNGKSLLSNTEITRLGTLSNYTHPANHAPSIIVQDPSNRFVTDAEKATWNAKQPSLTYVPENSTNKNIAGGYAGLGADGKLISSQLPAITINDTFVIASQAAMLALTVQTGDLAVRTDLNKSFILKGTNPAVLADWQELLTPTSAVTTVFGRNGAVSSQSGDYTADQVTETTTRKFQSANQQTFNDATSSIQTQLNAKEQAITAGTVTQYLRGDKTWQILDKTKVGLTNIDNTTDASKNVLSATKLTTTRTINGIPFDGTANISIPIPSAVTTVFGRNGAVTSQSGDYTADQITETTTRKFQSANQQTFNDATSSIQTQLNAKASTTGTGASGTWGINITGNANTATNSSQIGGISSNRLLMKRRNKIDTLDSTSLNSSITQPEMGFTYGGSGEPRGPYIAFGGLNRDIDYSCQLAGAYVGGNEFKIRTKNDDAAIWNPWRTLITDGNYATYSTFSGIVTSGNGFQTSGYLLNSRNRIWSFGNADEHGLSYFQGTSGWKGKDSIGFHFGTTTDAGSLFKIGNDGATQGLSFKTAPNASGKSLIISGSSISDANTASIYVSNGNLHLDPTNGSAIYLGHYSGNGTNFSNGANTVTANISASGVFSGTAVTSSSTVSAAQYFHTASAPGNGYGFWGGHPNTYGILMSDAGNSNYGGRIPGETTSDYNMYFSMAQGVNRGFVFRNAVNTPLLAIHNNGIRASNDVIAFSSSDERLKDNITKIQNPIEKLNKINGYMFDWNTNQTTHIGHDIGVIAQEIESIIPEIVTTRENGYKAVKYDKLVPLLIEVAKTQQLQIEKQQQIIEEQNDKIKFILKNLKS